jgi:CHAT domain-containing protein
VLALNRAISDLLLQIRAIDTKLANRYPHLAGIATPEPLTVPQVQSKLLDNDTILLEYWLGENRSYVFAVTRSTLHVYSLPPRSIVEAAAQQFYEALTSRSAMHPDSTNHGPASLTEDDAKAENIGRRLGSTLLGPVRNMVHTKRIVVVRDGALHYVPFAALGLPNGSSGGYVPVIAKYEAIELPSASVLKVVRARQRPSPGTTQIAVFADPVFDIADDRVAPQRRSPASGTGQNALGGGLVSRAFADLGIDGLTRLPRLVFSREEAASIVAATAEAHTTVELDFDASLSAVTGRPLRQYNILHFATHAIRDSVHPELSGLVFSMVDKDGTPRNGFLNLEEIYKLQLQADLVVLSACETGLGKNIRGEGLVGLTQGFLSAGAQSVVATSWKVGDYATSLLMRSFYTHMQKGQLKPIAALRLAQLDIWRQDRWRAPFYWAAFELYGEWQ